MQTVWYLAGLPLRWWCAFWLGVGVRATSSLERRLTQDVEQLRNDLRNRDERIATLEAEARVQKHENTLLASVNARDVMRIKSETSGYADKVAQGG